MNNKIKPALLTVLGIAIVAVILVSLYFTCFDCLSYKR
jgi:hypothetical protein